MFVDIEDFKGALAIENLLTPYKKGRLSPDKKTRLPKEKITPQVCMEVLRSTNYARNIKDMLQCIAELPPAEQVQFKEVILACFDNREQPTAIVELGESFVKKYGWTDEFTEVQQLREGRGLCSSSHLARRLVSSNEFWGHRDLGEYEKLICLNTERLQFDDIKNLPKIIDVSRCAKVQFSYMDLHGFEQMKFAQDADVSFRVTELPQNIDVSQCDNVVFEYTDTSHLKHLKFKENASVCFDVMGSLPKDRKKYRLPDDLDVSNCAKVEFNSYDLSAFNNLKFKDGAEVSFLNSTALPDDLDVANCSKVNFRGCVLKHFNEIHFNNAEFVSFAYVKSYPQVLDVSNCKNVYFAENVSDDMFKNSKKFIFKNRQQMNSFNFKTPENWSGQIVFADEQHDLNLALVAAKVKDGR